MKWLNRAEVKYGHLAIPNLPGMLVGLNALTFILYRIDPNYLEWLKLDIDRVVHHGEVWRLLSYLFVPSFRSIFGDFIGILFYLVYIWIIGSGLEYAIGSFKFNAYYLIGMIGITIAAVVSGEGRLSNALLNGSLFFAFARFYPERVFYMMYILPVKVKWLAWISGFFVVLNFIGGGTDARLGIFAMLMNYILFFGHEILQDAQHRSEVAVRKQRFDREIRTGSTEPLHRCAVCGQTDESNPDLEFRVSRDGQEYCTAHLPKPAAAEANS